MESRETGIPGSTAGDAPPPSQGAPAPRTASARALLAGVGALVLGQGMLNTLIGLRLDLAGSSQLVVGGVMTAYFAGYFAGTLAAPRLVARIGHIRAFAGLAALGAALANLHGMTSDPFVWALLRLAGGAAASGLLVVIESWLNGRATDRDRGAVLARYMTTYYVALGAGQFVLGAFEPGEDRLFAGAAVCFCAAVVPVALARHDAPQAPAPTYLGLRHVARRAPLAVAGSVVAGVLLGAFYSLGPVFARRIGLDPAGAARWMGAGILGGLALQWPLGRLSDRIGRALLLGLSCAALVPVCALLARSTTLAPAAAFALVAAFGAGAALVYPLSLAYGCDRFGQEERMSAGASLVLASAVGSMVGPLAGASAMRTFGPGGLFGLAGAFAALLAVYALHRRIRVGRLAPAVRRVFFAVPRTTAVVVELAPVVAAGGRRGDLPQEEKDPGRQEPGGG